MRGRRTCSKTNGIDPCTACCADCDREEDYCPAVCFQDPERCGYQGKPGVVSYRCLYGKADDISWYQQREERHQLVEQLVETNVPWAEIDRQVGITNSKRFYFHWKGKPFLPKRDYWRKKRYHP